MSRKYDLLNLMNIDTSWIKNMHNDTINLSNFNYLELEAKNCHACALSNTRNNVVFGKGNQKAKMLIIGEAPGKDEDLSGEPFVGRAGKLLNEILFSMKLSRDNVYITNTVKCRPPENRNPNSDEINSCSSFLDLSLIHI